MEKEEEKGVCEESHILLSEPYKEHSKDIIESEAMLSPAEYPNMVARILHDELIDKVSDAVREDVGGTEWRGVVTKVLKEEHGIHYNVDELVDEIFAIETEICFAAELVDDPHTIYKSLPPKEVQPKEQPSAEETSIKVTSIADPEHLEETGSVCDAVKEAVTTGVVQDAMTDHVDTPSHGLSMNVICQEQELPSK